MIKSIIIIAVCAVLVLGTFLVIESAAFINDLVDSEKGDKDELHNTFK